MLEFTAHLLTRAAMVLAFGSRHSTRDIPAMTGKASQKYPGVRCCVTDALGLDVRLAEVLHQRVLEALHQGG